MYIWVVIEMTIEELCKQKQAEIDKYFKSMSLMKRNYTANMKIKIDPSTGKVFYSYNETMLDTSGALQLQIPQFVNIAEIVTSRRLDELYIDCTNLEYLDLTRFGGCDALYVQGGNLYSGTIYWWNDRRRPQHSINEIYFDKSVSYIGYKAIDISSWLWNVTVDIQDVKLDALDERFINFIKVNNNSLKIRCNKSQYKYFKGLSRFKYKKCIECVQA